VAPARESGTLTEVRQAHLILVIGLPGTGKSTLARALASRYRTPIVCKDTIKEPLLDVIGAIDRAGSRQLSDASFAVMFGVARECLGAGTDLILEGNFRPGEHDLAVQELILGSPKSSVGTAAYPAASSGTTAGPTPAASSLPIVRIAQVLCRATQSVRIARLQARATDPSRHPGHRDAALANDAPPSIDDFLAVSGARFAFDSDARSAADVDSGRLQSLLNALDEWHSTGGART
jgi:predicted kinase